MYIVPHFSFIHVLALGVLCCFVYYLSYPHSPAQGFVLWGGKSLATCINEVNVGGLGGSEKIFKFSFSEVDFSAILYTQLCITLVLPCT